MNIAVAALRAGKKPLPNGSVLDKVAWKGEKNTSFPVITVPMVFAQVKFMVKDAGFVTECFGGHTPMAGNDYLFTKIVKTP